MSGGGSVAIKSSPLEGKRGRPRNDTGRQRDIDKVDALLVKVVEVDDTRVKLRRIGKRGTEWFAWSHLTTTRSAVLEAAWTGEQLTVRIVTWKLAQVGWMP